MLPAKRHFSGTVIGRVCLTTLKLCTHASRGSGATTPQTGNVPQTHHGLWQSLTHISQHMPVMCGQTHSRACAHHERQAPRDAAMHHQLAQACTPSSKSQVLLLPARCCCCHRVTRRANKVNTPQSQQQSHRHLKMLASINQCSPRSHHTA
jgi:hypothetical protein